MIKSTLLQYIIWVYFLSANKDVTANMQILICLPSKNDMAAS